MPQNYRLLNIPISPLKDGFEFPKDRRRTLYYKLSVEEVVNPTLSEFFKGVGLTPRIVNIFHNKPNTDSQPIHSDYTDGSFICSINWSFCEKSLMRWYKIKDKDIVPKLKLISPTHDNGERIKNISVFTISDKDVELIEETTDKGPMLVNIGSVLHNAQNPGSTERWVVSLRFMKENTPTWEDAIEKLQPWIIEQRM